MITAKFLRVATPARVNEAQHIAATILDGAEPVPRRVRNIVGERFGRLVVRAFAFTRTTGCKGSWWRCACDCGGSATVAACHLRSGSTVSCGCRRNETGYENADDLLGRVFGHLTVIARAGSTGDPPVALWLCRCDAPTGPGGALCGARWRVRAVSLKRGQKSCGCLSGRRAPVALERGAA